MNFLEPLGLLGLTALIPVIALYFLKLKREERTVPSTLLWKKVIDDLQVNAPFQRLKYSLLLLLQLLLVAVLGFALARPYLSLTGYAGQKIILLIDTSASMGTRDADNGKLTRLEAAVKAARAKVDDLRQNDEMLLVAFDKDVRQLTKFMSDRTLLKGILSDLQPREVDTRADEAIETALALSEGQNNVKVLVLSDGCFGSVKLLKESESQAGNVEDVAAKGGGESLASRLSNFRFIAYGDETSDNAAITQIDARSRPIKAIDADGKRVDSVETQIFVMVENFAPKRRDIVLSLSLNGQRIDTKSVTLNGRIPREETMETHAVDGSTDESSRSVEVFRLQGGASGVVTARIDAPKDKLAVDDTASVVIGVAEGIKLLVVSKATSFGKLNFFLEKALGAMRGLQITTMAPDEFLKAWDQKGQQTVESYDACIFDEVAPIAWSDGGALFLGALPPLPGFAKAEKLAEFPAVIDWDGGHGVMRYVSFGNVTVAKAQSWSVPKTARVLVEGGAGPLVAAFENDRVRVVGVAFDGFSSDWALRPSWPLFCRNVVPWIADASPRRRPACQQTGEPIVVPPGLGADTANLHKPDGSIEDRVQLSQEHATLIPGTEKAGLYYLRGLPGEDPNGRAYAVNLSSRGESDNAARGSLKVGEVKLASSPSAIEAKREIWHDLAIAAAVMLMLEWWIFHRRVGM